MNFSPISFKLNSGTILTGKNIFQPDILREMNKNITSFQTKFATEAKIFLIAIYSFLFTFLGWLPNL